MSTFNTVTVQAQPTAPGTQRHSSSFPLCQTGGTGTCSGSLGIEGNVSKVLVPQAGDSVDVVWHKEPDSQRALEQGMVLAITGRNGVCLEGAGDLVPQHLVTGVWKGTGQEVSLAGGTWSGQEHIGRHPSMVPAFTRCSVSHATMPLSADVPLSPDFPPKLLLFLLQFPQHHFRSPSECPYTASLVLCSALCCQCSKNTTETQGAAAARGSAIGHSYRVLNKVQ